MLSSIQISNHQRRGADIHNNIEKIISKIFQKSSNIFCHIKILLQQWNKNYFKKIHHHLFNNQSLKLTSLSEIDNIIQEEEEIFKKNCIKRKMDSLCAPRISHHLMDQAMKQPTHQFHKIFFRISKYLPCNAEKLLQLKITKKRMNVTNL